MILYIVSFILILLIALSFTSFEIKDQITINASIETVWKAIIDFESYHLWNSQLEYLGGDIRPQGKLHLRLSAAGTNPYEFKPTINHWVEFQKFAWIGRTGLPKVFDGEHFFELQPLNERTILLTNREEYRGVLSLIIKQLPMMKSAPQGFVLMNQELKAYIENTLD